MHALWLTVPSLAATPVTVALQGGAQLTVLARPQAADVALADWIDLGSADDPLELPGAAHLLEHLAVDAGSPDGLEAQLADLGGAVSAFTGTDYTRLNVRVLPWDLPAALSVLATRTLELSITPSALARELPVIAEELAGRSRGTLTRITATVDAALWTDHPYARASAAHRLPPPEAPPETLQQLLDRGYAPAAHHLVVVGPVEPAVVIAQARESFARPDPDPAATHRTPSIDQAALPERLEETSRTPLYRVGGAVWPLPPASDPDFWPLRVALDLLESDRSQALALLPREGGAAQVGVDVSWGRAGGRLLLATLHPSLRDPDRVRAEGAAFAGAVADPGWLSDARIEAALRAQERRLLAAAWDTAETARWLGWSASLRGTARSPEQIAASIQALSPEAVRAAWRRWITPAAAIPVLLHVG